MTTLSRLRVFICHASENAQFAQHLSSQLVARGFAPWRDKEMLVGGHDWELEISKALRSADAVILCLSKASVSKDGFVQKELRLALDIAKEKPEGRVYLVPCCIDDCTVPHALRPLHRVHSWEEGWFERLVAALEATRPSAVLVGRHSPDGAPSESLPLPGTPGPISFPSAPIADTPERRFFGHPIGLVPLSFAMLWERFGFYGFRSVLMLYLIGELAGGGRGLAIGDAAHIFAVFLPSIHLAALLGGWIADRWLGLRQSALIGVSCTALGYASFCIDPHGGLGWKFVLLTVGTGLVRPTIATLVGDLYPSTDARRDAGFTLFYAGMNAGAFLGPLVCGALAFVSWRASFAAPAAAMSLSVLHLILLPRYFAQLARTPKRPQMSFARLRATLTPVAVIVAVNLLVFAGVCTATIVGAAGPFAYTIPDTVPNWIVNGMGVLILVVVILLFSSIRNSHAWPAGRNRALGRIALLFCGAAIFWAAFEQSGTGLMVFTENHVRHSVFGIRISAAWIVSLSPALTVILAPFVATILSRPRLSRASTPTKFAIGLGFGALGFSIAALAASRSSSGEVVTFGWLVAISVALTLGDLCISPLGLSAVTRLAPTTARSAVVATWFLAAALGSYLAARAVEGYESNAPVAVFSISAGACAVACAGLLIASRLTSREAW